MRRYQPAIADALSQIRDQAISFAQSTATNVVNIAFIVTNTLIDILLELPPVSCDAVDDGHSVGSLKWSPWSSIGKAAAAILAELVDSAKRAQGERQRE